MLVIEGKNNKKRVLENWIRKEYMGERMAIIDNQSVNAISLIENIDYYPLKESVPEMINNFKIMVDGVFSKYDWIVFYVNATTDDLALFQELDRQIIQNIVVTIQKNNQSLTGKYFL